MSTFLELEPDEQMALEETLQRALNDLQVEVGHTDSRDFKAMLRRRKGILDRLLHKLQGSHQPA